MAYVAPGELRLCSALGLEIPAAERLAGRFTVTGTGRATGLAQGSAQGSAQPVAAGAQNQHQDGAANDGAAQQRRPDAQPDEAAAGPVSTKAMQKTELDQ
mmetsp:Transcript_14855/g.27853  ORF Transcript_14855/g.27853 Transcript_14855/m.27853 type:complete len:100 (-) Transcript_14855:157-456(-)